MFWEPIILQQTIDMQVETIIILRMVHLMRLPIYMRMLILPPCFSIQVPSAAFMETTRVFACLLRIFSIIIVLFPAIIRSFKAPIM